MTDYKMLWLAALMKHLREAKCGPHAPRYDIEWLLDLCSDVLKFEGELRYRAFLEVQKEVGLLVEQWPGIIPPDLVHPERFRSK